MKKRTKPFLAAGISSLLLIFLSLCLLTFSILSLSNAQADFKLASKLADGTKAYYEASNLANDKLEEVDLLLSELYEKGLGEDEYFSALPQVLSAYSLDGRHLSFQTMIDENQVLSVTLEILYPQSAEDTFYTITAWQAVNTRDWTPDTRQNLYIQPETAKDSAFRTEDHNE